jgi:uncharacterized protein YyaL (SSP411 family)
MPSFRQLLAAVVQAWQERPDELLDGAKQVVAHLAGQTGPLKESVVDEAALAGAVGKLEQEADPVNGGFGRAPKFPPSMVLEFLLRHHERTGSRVALSLVDKTAEAMARGGMYDQLAGGFARYSVDAEWIVPHFEKMLYDNALLLRFYAHLWRRTGSATALRVATGTAGFLFEGLRTPEGGFASSLDADTEGVEGLTYVWTPSQLREVLGDEDGAAAAELFGVTEEGTFEHGTSTLRLFGDLPEHFRVKLLEVRAKRPQPGRDDKVIASWNGLAITALAEAGVALDRPQWIEWAVDAAELLLRVHVVDGRLRRSSRDGVAGESAGVLEDYACVADGFLALHQATGAAKWLTEATRLLDLALTHFASPDVPGAYFDTADDAEALVQRPADPGDNASPSGASALAGALLTASALAGHADSARYRDAAEQALRRAGVLAGRVPRFAGHWLSVAEALQAGPVQVAVVGDAPALRLAAARGVHGGGIVLAGEPDAPGVPLLADRPLVDGGPAAYVCRGYVCDRPVTSAEALTAQL